MPTRPVPRLILLVAIAVAVAGCGGDPDPSGSPPAANPVGLAGTSWIVVSVGGRAPVPGAVPTIRFTEDTVTGSGGCNHIGGRYRLEPSTGRMLVSELGGTAMGCLQPGVGDFETVFLQALGSTTEASLDGTGRLLLGSPQGRILLAPDRPVP